MATKENRKAKKASTRLTKGKKIEAVKPLVKPHAAIELDSWSFGASNPAD